MAKLEIKHNCGHWGSLPYTSGAGAIEKLITRESLVQDGSRLVSPKNCRRCGNTTPTECRCNCDGFCEMCESAPCFKMHRDRALGIS